jgi:hypothetical protein
MGIILFSTGAYGQTPSELGFTFLPNKIIENTDAVLQVYDKGDSLPHNINNLIATSSDSSIIQISAVEEDQNNFVTSVKFHALNPGTATIALAAPGFSSQEVPVTVFSDSKAPTKLLIKTTPNTFSTLGNEKGYVAVELANDAKVPIKARQDTVITLTTDSNIVNLQNTQLTIKTGDYFAIEEFEVKKDGSAQISASAASMATVSSSVTISTSETQKTIQLYVFPKILNSYQNSFGYVIAQLQEGGVPVQATEDITLPIQVTNATGLQMINTSGENPTVVANDPIVIKKGSYWGYTQISVIAGITGWIPTSWGMEGQWNVGLNTKGYIISPVVQVSTTPGPLLDDHTASLDLLPILATGQDELIGVVHLENDSVTVPGPPVIANSDLKIEIDSSDTNTLSVDPVTISRGTGSALVFAKVASTVPIQPTIQVVTVGPPSLPQTYSTTISVISSKSFALVADPVLPAILTDNEFPLAVYMTKDGMPNYFINDITPFISPQDTLQTESKTFHQGDSIVLINSTSLKVGSSTISISAGDFATSLSINSLSSKPTLITIGSSDKILSNFKNAFSIQLLDSQGNPVFLEDDTQFKLISSDPTILNVPETIVIKKGSYYSLFDAESNQSGTTELAVLTNNLPLAKFNIVSTSLIPAVTITSNDYVDPNTVFIATINAMYQGVPLSGMKVDWSVTGAAIQTKDSLTDKDGNAKISLLAQDPKTINVVATISGAAFSATPASKTINVNQPLVSATGSNTGSNTTSGSTPFSLFGINPMFIVIPVAAAAAGGIIILKKKNMLDGITEKISIMEKISGIKDRITQLREK